MADNRGFYNVYSYGDHLEPGSKLTIEHSISFLKDKADLSPLVDRPMDDLIAMREGRAAKEQ